MSNIFESEQNKITKPERIDESITAMQKYMKEKYGAYPDDISYFALNELFKLIEKVDPDGKQDLKKVIFDKIMKQAEESGKNIEKRKTGEKLENLLRT